MKKKRFHSESLTTRGARFRFMSAVLRLCSLHRACPSASLQTFVLCRAMKSYLVCHSLFIIFCVLKRRASLLLSWIAFLYSQYRSPWFRFPLPMASLADDQMNLEHSQTLDHSVAGKDGEKSLTNGSPNHTDDDVLVATLVRPLLLPASPCHLNSLFTSIVIISLTSSSSFNTAQGFRVYHAFGSPSVLLPLLPSRSLSFPFLLFPWIPQHFTQWRLLSAFPSNSSSPFLVDLRRPLLSSCAFPDVFASWFLHFPGQRPIRRSRRK